MISQFHKYKLSLTITFEKENDKFCLATSCKNKKTEKVSDSA